MAKMTAREEAAKEQIIRVLRKEGYPTYARLFDLFDLNLTDDPNVIGYMLPGKAKIVLNENLSIDQVSVVVRHEILHEWLSHGPRSEAFDKAHPDLLPDHDTSNIAADFEISNLGYTDKDKRTERNLIMGDEILQGLITEDQFPGWEDKTFEEMYEELLKKTVDEKRQLLDMLKKLHKMLPEDEDDGQDGEENPNQSGGIQINIPDSNQGDSNTNQDEDNQNSKASKAKQAIEDAKDKIEDIDKEKEAKGNVFDSDKEQKEKSDLAKRIEEIRKLLDNPDYKEQAKSETKAAIDKEKIAKSAKIDDRYRKDPLVRFTLNLNNFIKEQTANYRGDTWTRFNKTSIRTGLIKPGRTQYQQTNIPEINVYWDVSGSFSNPAKTAGARRAIGTLQKYVNERKIKINVWYFANRVGSDADNVGSGTAGQPILDHIQQTRPTNVIIITDSDISDCKSNISVPGAVWLLFYDAESQNLREHLRGKQETKAYLITNY
ncbi:MAG: hypothetical protein ACI3T9_06770 [Romboutsia timonensis]